MCDTFAVKASTAVDAIVIGVSVAGGIILLLVASAGVLKIVQYK